MGYYNELSMTPDSRPFSDEGWSIDERRTPALPPPTPAVTEAPKGVTKRIGEWDKETKDYPAFICFEDGREEYIGSRPTQHDASLLASDYIIQFYNDNHTPEAAARLIHEELAQEGRHEQAARDMGGVWVTGECWKETGAPESCPSCGDASAGLCAACKEVGEMRVALRETIQSLPVLTKETLKVYRDGPSWAL